jgi:phosphoglucosamine mutase
MAEEGTLAHNTVVTTPMSNLGMELTLKDRGIAMVRAQVGDRYVVDTMRKNGFNLGGEQSGHIIFLDQSTTGDGIVAALKVLEAMKRTGKKLSELKKAIHLFPQARDDVRITRREKLDNLPTVRAAIQAGEKELAGRGRVFVRFSGTEPLCRILVEGESEPQIKAIAASIAGEVRKHLG